MTETRSTVCEYNDVVCDLHMHSTVSDGTDAPEGILEHVVREGINYFSLTDHDAYKGAEILTDMVKSYSGIHFTPGIEFSSKDTEGKYHILGYGFDPAASSMWNMVEKAHDNRVYKVLSRLDFLRKEFGFTFTLDELDELMQNPNPGKPHIGNLMVKKGYAKDRTTAINSFINKYRGKTPRLNPPEVISAILEAGGIPVLAHPIYGDGGQNLTWDELDVRIDRLMEMGLQGIECYYSKNSAEQNEHLVKMAEEKHLYISAGSDYHGRNKTVRLGENGFPACGELPEGMRRLFEKLF